MMETASPRLSERETPERIGRGPRGDGYCLVRFVASSKLGSYIYDTVAADDEHRIASRSYAWLRISAGRADREMCRHHGNVLWLGSKDRVRYFGAGELRGARDHLAGSQVRAETSDQLERPVPNGR